MGAEEEDFYIGLQALVESAFPKTCATCGHVYTTSEQFLQETTQAGGHASGLRQTKDFDGSTIVEAFRNCVCGSTMMDGFNNRRNMSEQGEHQRQKFASILAKMIDKGIEPAIARDELLKVMHGEGSSAIKEMLKALTK